ncbi:MAG: hypothetical protein GX298_05395 [Planctomycetes bacterium]|jgi:uncharacterized paraquat-inducible protein A|nr:hypothetical protein [Planctomycetota bacterium]
MRLLTKCPACSIAVELSIAHADRRTHCPRCGKLFRLPDTDALHEALALLRSAQCDVYVDEKGNVYG